MSRRIFVFGSNLQGNHGAGAAVVAHHKWGYPTGLGVGYHKQSRCYAIPTMSGLDVMVLHVEQFLDFAAMMKRLSPSTTFQVTRIGCGIAGHSDDVVSGMFRKAPSNCLFDRKWERGGWLPRKARYWGTFG